MEESQINKNKLNKKYIYVFIFTAISICILCFIGAYLWKQSQNKLNQLKEQLKKKLTPENLQKDLQSLTPENFTEISQNLTLEKFKETLTTKNLQKISKKLPEEDCKEILTKEEIQENLKNFTPKNFQENLKNLTSEDFKEAWGLLDLNTDEEELKEISEIFCDLLSKLPK